MKIGRKKSVKPSMFGKGLAYGLSHAWQSSYLANKPRQIMNKSLQVPSNLSSQNVTIQLEAYSMEGKVFHYYILDLQASCTCFCCIETDLVITYKILQFIIVSWPVDSLLGLMQGLNVQHEAA